MKSSRPKRQIVVIAHNIRSTHNVGSLLRTAEGLGVTGVFLTGYTPFPAQSDDNRLPHLSQKIESQIHKTALGAERQLNWQYSESFEPVLLALRKTGFAIVGVEQTPNSKPLPGYSAPAKVAIILGREVEGLEPEIQAMCDDLIEIPMFGQKESFNVVQAAAMVLYQLTFH